MRADNLTQISGAIFQRPSFGTGQAYWNQMKEIVTVWAERSRYRNELRLTLGNDERFFSDIGISRATIYNESQKWFWQA